MRAKKIDPNLVGRVCLKFKTAIPMLFELKKLEMHSRLARFDWYSRNSYEGGEIIKGVGIYVIVYSSVIRKIVFQPRYIRGLVMHQFWKVS